MNLEKISTSNTANDLTMAKVNDRGTREAVREYRKYREGKPDSEIAKNIPQAVTWGVPLPWERKTTIKGKNRKAFESDPKTLWHATFTENHPLSAAPAVRLPRKGDKDMGGGEPYQGYLRKDAAVQGDLQ